MLQAIYSRKGVNMDKTYKIVVRFEATDEDDAVNFVESMSANDWLEHLEEE